MEVNQYGDDFPCPECGSIMADVTLDPVNRTGTGHCSGDIMQFTYTPKELSLKKPKKKKPKIKLTKNDLY